MRSFTWGALLMIISLAASPQASTAQGGYPAAYMELMEGARPVGMGSAFVALADDVNAIFFNPAGLSAIPHKEATFTTLGDMGFDRRANLVAVTVPNHPGESAWGLSYSRFSVTGIPETRVDAFGHPIVDAAGNVVVFNLFDNIEENGVVSYSWKQTDQLRVGVNARVVHFSQLDVKASGQGLDLGALYQPTDDVRIGFAFRDIFERYVFSTGAREDIPFKLSLGVAVRGWKDIVYATEIQKIEDQHWVFHLGAEKWFLKHYAVRLGISDGNFTAGLSAKYRQLQFDYSFRQEDLKDENRLSLTCRF